MKIDRLYTLSQFDDYLKSLSKEEFFKLDNINKPLNWFSDLEVEGLKYNCFRRYKKRVLDSLTKDMFVNPIIKPVSNFDLDDIELLQFKEWQESEKKVIFEGFKNSQYYAFNCHNDKIRVNFSNSDYIRYESMFTDDNKIIKNLYDLAEKTNGELKLKNFEI